MTLTVTTPYIWSSVWSSEITLIGSSIFFFMVGVLIGALIRSTLPAMFVTLIVLVALSLLMINFSNYIIPPLRMVEPVSIAISGNVSEQTEDLSLYSGYADQNGHAIGPIAPYCGSSLTYTQPGYATMVNTCVATHHLQWLTVYQPASRFWPIQFANLALLLILSAALVPLIYAVCRRRLQ